MMTFGEWLGYTLINIGDRGNMRLGQYFYNRLFFARSDLAEKIVSTEVDPFHNDDNLIAFFNYLQENWNE
jgi:hypothetical protein